MTDQDVRRVLIDAVPPLVSPPDRVEAVEQLARRQRMRFAGTTVAASVTLLALAAGAFATLNTGQAKPPASSAAAPSVVLPTAPPARKSTKDGLPTEEPAVAKARLKAAAEAAVRQAAPGATVTKSFPVQHMNVAGSYGYNIGLLISANGRKGSVVLTFEMPEKNRPYTCASEVAPDAHGCHDLTGPNGEHIMALPATGDGKSNGKRNRATILRVIRTDGTIVTMDCDNATKLEMPGGLSAIGDTTTFGFNSTGYTGLLPPLTLEQATAIALDPTLTMYP